MHVFRLKTRRHHQRAGISLLEVIISIGIASVGLLGVLALIPLGGAQARQGQIYERAANIGIAAMGEVRSRDLTNPMNLLMYDSVNMQYALPYNIMYRGSRQSFCLDPQGFSTTNSVFPAQGAAQMARLTLNNGSGVPVSAEFADFIFRSHDDLSLNVSESDRTLPPTQVWSRSNDPSATPTRRQSRANMSWMMTAFPNMGKGADYSYDLWTVSIVVFSNRVLDTNLRSEFTANVTSMPGGGVAGGDIEIAFDTSVYTADDINEAKTPENSWLLLSGQVPYGMSTINVFQWYRVLASDNVSANERVVTLAGPDWPAGASNVQATIIPTTVAVFQKNMRLELGSGTSLWRN
jgi:Tfp pilus assembly protein PilV